MPSFDHLTTVFVVFLWPAWRTCKPSKVLLAYVPLFFFLSSFGLLVVLCVFFLFFSFLLFFFYSVLRPFQDYFSSYETGQSVFGAKTGEPQEKPPGIPTSRTWLVSHVPSAGLEPTTDTALSVFTPPTY